MFSGIIEELGEVMDIRNVNTNFHYTISNPFKEDLYIDQSIAHNGCCLTVVKINNIDKTYEVTAIEETLNKTNLRSWKIGTKVNLERCIKADTRMDGHFVQGHVDIQTECISMEDKNGSWEYIFKLPRQYAHLVVDKGSIAINGTSLTLILSEDISIFKVAIIPYTYEYTNFHHLGIGDSVNIEFDILGKYIARASFVNKN
jgi:riboflavin synthase